MLIGMIDCQETVSKPKLSVEEKYVGLSERRWFHTLSGNDDHDLSVILHYHRLEHGFAYFLFEKFMCIVWRT